MCRGKLLFVLCAALLCLASGVHAARVQARKLYVANTGGDSITVINLATRKVVSEIPVGPTPHGLGVSPDGRRLYVAENTGDARHHRLN